MQLSRRVQARSRAGEDGGVRIIAHVALPSSSLHRAQDTPSTAESNVRIAGNNVSLGALSRGGLEGLRVDFSRVFAYHVGGDAEAFFNRNVTVEVRPWVSSRESRSYQLRRTLDYMINSFGNVSNGKDTLRLSQVRSAVRGTGPGVVTILR